jgi:MOSC domain-containing protein YiiM
MSQPSDTTASTASRTGTVASVNVNPAGGVPKLPVPQTTIRRLGVEGDKQRNLKYHGGPKRAVCLYSADLIAKLNAEGHPIAAGTTGENLTLAGVDWSLMTPGARLTIGDEVELSVTDFTVPCSHIRESFTDLHFKRIGQEDHPGWSRVYARVIREGVVRVGDCVTVTPAVDAQAHLFDPSATLPVS